MQMFHLQASMTGLKPSTIYYYTVGDAASGVMSPVMHFTSAPSVGPDHSTAFIAFGDMGNTNYGVDGR